MPVWFTFLVSTAQTAPSSFTVYWRPGCGFCARLFRQLDRHDLDPVVVDIWSDDEARRWLGDRIGSETVPTVVVGDQVMVNPRVEEVVAALGG